MTVHKPALKKDLINNSVVSKPTVVSTLRVCTTITKAAAAHEFSTFKIVLPKPSKTGISLYNIVRVEW